MIKGRDRDEREGGSLPLSRLLYFGGRYCTLLIGSVTRNPSLHIIIVDSLESRRNKRIDISPYY